MKKIFIICALLLALPVNAQKFGSGVIVAGVEIKDRPLTFFGTDYRCEKALPKLYKQIIQKEVITGDLIRYAEVWDDEKIGFDVGCWLVRGDVVIFYPVKSEPIRIPLEDTGDATIAD
jgi:hypothetical protein